MEILEIIIGLVFIFLLLSLLATTIQEIVAALLSMRGQVLLQAIAKLLEIENLEEATGKTRKQLLAEFKERVRNSQVYDKYSSYFLWFKRLPSYLSAEQVADVIKEILEDEEGQAETPDTTSRSLDGGAATSSKPSILGGIRQSRLRSSLTTILEEDLESSENGDFGEGLSIQTRGLSDAVDEFQIEVAKAKDDFKRYYEETMDRATGWYKRNVQRNLLIIGLILGMVFDADTFKIYTNLTKFPDDRQQLIELAVGFSESDVSRYTPEATDSTAQLEDVSELKALVDSLLINEINEVPAPLGLGRSEGFPAKVPEGAIPWQWRITKFFGWIVTALAVSMGAPFWFDILQRLIHIRNAGNRPEDAKRTGPDQI